MLVLLRLQTTYRRLNTNRIIIVMLEKLIVTYIIHISHSAVSSRQLITAKSPCVKCR